MQKIEIREKLAPYSHTPGIRCLVPLSDYIVQVYPTALLVQGITIPLSLTPDNFTVQIDLERDCVWIWDKKKRLKLTATDSGLSLDQQLIATGGKACPKLPCERLSLGNWKAQDWDLIRRRKSLAEIAPSLFLFGQKTPIHSLSAPDFFSPETILGHHFPYQTLRAHLIDGATILPHLPSEWHAGRAHLQTPFGALDLEWTKHRLRRMILRATDTKPVAFNFKLRSCRCNGVRLENQASLEVESGKVYYFDRFEN